MAKLKKKNKKRSPIIVIMVLILVTLIAACVLSLIGVGGYKTSIANGGLETSLVSIRNPLSIKGICALVSQSVNNFLNFKPLIYFLICIIGIGVLNKSGLLDAITKPFKNVKINIIIFMTFIISILFTYFGEYSYTMLIPLTALVYKKLGKNPILGVIVCFIGITACYGTNFIFNYDDFSLGELTKASATLEVDKNYKFVLSSTLFIMISSCIILSIIGTLISKKTLEMNIYDVKKEEQEEAIYSKRALLFSTISFLILLGFIIYLVLPLKLPGAGILLGNGKTYVERLFSTTSPFRTSFSVLFVLICSACGVVYGFISKNFKNSHDFGSSLSSLSGSIGSFVVYSFAISQLVSIISWTRIGEVISYRLIEFMNTLQFSGIPLIIVFFLVVVIISLLVPDMYTKWTIISPTIVPLFMRSNITPDFTQFIFRAADGIGKCLTPVFGYFIVMLAVIDYYKKDEITLGGIFKKMLPIVLTLAGVWILILIGWYVIGLPLGVSTGTTL